MKTISYLANKFPALAHRDFRLYWFGQSVSLLGTWMQNIGMTWLVLTMTDSPLLLGILEAVRFLPITLFSLFAGVVIDRYPKKSIILATQTISMLLAFSLAALVFTGQIRYEYVLVLALITGFCNTMDWPARQSFVVELTGKADLMNAVALSSVTFNLARIVGPAIGALVLAGFGAGWCFLLNGLSFLAVIGSLMLIKAKPYPREQASHGHILREIADGLKYIAGDRTLLPTVFLIVILGVFAFNFEILIPVFTKSVLGQGEKVFGVLMSALGIGSLLGAIMVSVRSQDGPPMKALILSAVLISLLLIGVSFTRVDYLTAVGLVLAGMMIVWFSTTANTILQLKARDEYRGRVMSVYVLVNSGTAPFGYLFAGGAADRLGAGPTFLLSGVLALAFIVPLSLYFGLAARRDRPQTG